MKRGENAFTLIEVLVSITILAAISILVWQAMGSTVKAKEHFEAQDEAFRNASLAMERVARDLRMAFLFSKPEILGLTPSGEQMSKNVFIGVDEGENDKVTFNTFSHLRYLKNAKESDQAEVSYFVEAGLNEAGEPTEEEEEVGMVLKKREQSPPDVQPEEGGKVIPVLAGVKVFNLRYYHIQKDEFVDAWDSTGIDNLNTLPRAVEVTLGVQSPVDEEQVLKFKTVVFLEMAPGPNDF